MKAKPETVAFQKAALMWVSMHSCIVHIRNEYGDPLLLDYAHAFTQAQWSHLTESYYKKKFALHLNYCFKVTHQIYK